MVGMEKGNRNILKGHLIGGSFILPIKKILCLNGNGGSHSKSEERSHSPSYIVLKYKGGIEMLKFYKNDYGQEMDKDKFMSLQSLIKNNDGLFKSDKQGRFILWKWTIDDLEEMGEGHWINNFIGVKEGHKYIVVDGFYSFSHGRGKGHRPASFCYEMDAHGVVARYKSRYTGDGDSYSLKSVEKDWERAVETPIETNTEAHREVSEAPESKWIGEVGERLTDLKLMVKYVNGFDGQFGFTYVYKMEDEDGNQFTWFTQKSLEQGQSYIVRGTVKKHDEFRGVKQTVLTRCHLKEVS